MKMFFYNMKEFLRKDCYYPGLVVNQNCIYMKIYIENEFISNSNLTIIRNNSEIFIVLYILWFVSDRHIQNICGEV